MLNTPSRPCADCGVIVRRKYARYCDAHRWRHRIKNGVHPKWTPERDAYVREHYDSTVKGRAAEVARALRVPRWKVQKRAAELGLTRPQENRRPWTQEEEQFLWTHAGSRSLNWMRRKLGRSPASVALKLKRMRISRRWREGYTLRDLEQCFGVDHRVIEKWAAEGKLAMKRRGVHEGARDGWFVTDADILRFIQAHPMEFELRRVDQQWFMDLMLGGAVIRRALGIAEQDEEAA